MTAEAVRRVAYREPFAPFSVLLKSGERIDVRRSLRCTVAEDRIVLGVDEDPDRGVARRMRMIPLDAVVGVEEVSTA